jgi:hypothetical protein
MDYSSMSLNRSTIEQRQSNLKFIRVLHLLVAIELVLTIIWASFSIYFWDELGAPIVHWWEFAIVAGCLVGVLLLVALALQLTRRPPINWVIYGLFTLSFAHLFGFLACLDKTRLVYFALWVLTAVTLAVFLHWLVSIEYINTLTSTLTVFGSAAIVLLAFLTFSEINPLFLIMVYLAASIFGVFLTRGIRISVKSTIHESDENEPVSGAVRIWGEGLLVCFRFGELFGNSFRKI